MNSSVSVCMSVCLSVCLAEDAVDQSVIGSWSSVPPSVTSPPLVKPPATAAPAAGALPPVDNLTIDNIDDLPDIHTQSPDNVSQLSKTLIEFLLTRQVE